MFVLADILEPLRIITEASQKQDFTIDGVFAILDQQTAILEMFNSTIWIRDAIQQPPEPFSNYFP